MKKKLLIIVILCIFCSAMFLENMGTKEKDGDCSGKSNLTFNKKKINNILNKPIVTPDPNSERDKKYGLYLPGLPEILKDFKFQVCLSGWYEIRSVDMDGAIYFVDDGLLDKKLSVRIYYDEDTFYDEDVPVYSVICAVPLSGEDGIYDCFEIAYASQGLISCCHLRWKDKLENVSALGDVYSYLGKGDVLISKEEMDSFSFLPKETSGRRDIIKGAKKAIKKQFKDWEITGKYAVYLENFMEGDILLYFRIVDERKEKVYRGALKQFFEYEDGTAKYLGAMIWSWDQYEYTDNKKEIADDKFITWKFES